MNQSETTKSDPSPSFAVGLFLLLVIIFLSFTPVFIERLNKLQKWEPSDGSSADYVSYKPTYQGVEVVLAPTESTTREAYFSQERITPAVFRLSTEVRSPIDCGNDCRKGLIFRGNAQGEYYLFLVSQTSYTVEILRRKDNVDLPREAIILNTSIPKGIGKPQVIAVAGSGTSYSFYINNILVNSMSDSRLNGDRIGVEVFT
jgi:hypothetical protein